MVEGFEHVFPGLAGIRVSTKGRETRGKGGKEGKGRGIEGRDGGLPLGTSMIELVFENLKLGHQESSAQEHRAGLFAVARSGVRFG